MAKYGQVRSALDGAMTRPDNFGGGALGPVHAAWSALHGAATTFMKDTQTNLDETAAALTEAAELYQATDQAAAKEFRRLLAERGEPTPGK